jgi:hypothetical protein
VRRVNFNSTTADASQDRTLAALEDLTTTAGGPIKLVAEGGTITINGGSDTAGVSADGTGDVLLEARGTASDVVVNASVASGTGHITLSAADDVDVNATLTTGGAGTVYITADDNEATGLNGISLDAIRPPTQSVVATAAHVARRKHIYQRLRPGHTRQRVAHRRVVTRRRQAVTRRAGVMPTVVRDERVRAGGRFLEIRIRNRAAKVLARSRTKIERQRKN